MHIDDEGVLEVGEELPFMQYGLYRLLDDNLALVHFLHGVEFVSPFSLDFPDLPEAAPADDEVELEVGDVDVWGERGYLRLRMCCL